MENNLTNLLPMKRQKRLAREYLFRLGVVTIYVCVVLIAAAAAFLIPTFVMLTYNGNAKEVQLASVNSVLAASDEASLANRLSALSKDAAALVILSKRRTASDVLRETLAVPRPGVSLMSFVYSPVKSYIPNTLALTGTTTTRDDLRNYQLAFQAQPFVSAADLPVSVYAKDTDINFTLTLTLAP